MGDHASKLQDTIDLLNKTETGRSLLSFARQNNTHINICTFDASNKGRGYYSPQNNNIDLNDNLSARDLAPVLAHEIFHAWQDRQNLLRVIMPNFGAYVVYFRLIEATAFAVGELIESELNNLQKDERNDSKPIFCDRFNAAAKKGLDYFIQEKQPLYDEHFNKLLYKKIDISPLYQSNVHEFSIDKDQLRMWAMMLGQLPDGRNLILDDDVLNCERRGQLTTPVRFKHHISNPL